MMFCINNAGMVLIVQEAQRALLNNDLNSTLILKLLIELSFSNRNIIRYLLFSSDAQYIQEHYGRELFHGIFLIGNFL